MCVRRAEQFLDIGIEVPSEPFFESGRGGVVRHSPGAFERVSYVVEPDDFSVRGVEEGHSEFAEVERIPRRALGVALGLCEDVLRAEGELFRLDDGEYPPVDEKSVIRRPVLGGEFFDSNSVGGIRA